MRAEQDQQPYLIPIGERVTRVLEGYDDRQITTQQALDQVAKLVREYLDARKERTELGLDASTFTLYQEMKREGLAQALTLAGALEGTFQRHAHFRDNSSVVRNLKAELYKELLPVLGKDRMIDVVDRLLRLWKPEIH